MKKLLFSLAIPAFFIAACNSSTENTSNSTPTETSTSEPVADQAGQVQTDIINNTNTAGEVAPDPATLAAITFETYNFDFGKIKEGDKVSHVFKFTNTGANDLIITDARGSCGCTVPQWPKEPVKPGASGEIKVEFDSKGKTGLQNKTVSVTANTNPSTSTINITSEVIPSGNSAAATTN